MKPLALWLRCIFWYGGHERIAWDNLTCWRCGRWVPPFY